jgi:hypothetical protein
MLKVERSAGAAEQGVHGAEVRAAGRDQPPGLQPHGAALDELHVQPGGVEGGQVGLAPGAHRADGPRARIEGEGEGGEQEEGEQNEL